MFESDKVKNNQQTIKLAKRSVMKKIFFLGMVLAMTLVVSAWLVPAQYLVYSQIFQVGVIGYLFVEITAKTAFRLALSTLHSTRTAKSIRSITRISGAIVIAVVAVSYLSQNAAVAASIGTMSALVIGFASQNLLGNMIAGMYIAITRPFKIGDMITVFGITGNVHDIGLLNCDLLMKDGNIVRTPNTSLLTTPITIILQTGDNSKTQKQQPSETSPTK
ncbi:MAG: mechanosensitive ion channel domain-containing protein [Candidatus Nitrosocosmicus sp.]